jgi:hypothetical protein
MISFRSGALAPSFVLAGVLFKAGTDLLITNPLSLVRVNSLLGKTALNPLSDLLLASVSLFQKALFMPFLLGVPSLLDNIVIVF